MGIYDMRNLHVAILSIRSRTIACLLERIGCIKITQLQTYNGVSMYNDIDVLVTDQSSFLQDLLGFHIIYMGEQKEGNKKKNVTYLSEETKPEMLLEAILHVANLKQETAKLVDLWVEKS